MTNIERYYNKFNEEHRLTTRHGQVEFATTMHFIHDFIPTLADENGHVRIADIGAGTGRYSVALSEEGHTVTAVELVPKNLAVLESKHAKVNCWPGDARDLSFLQDESFDITLVFGPLYHLHTEDDRLKALSEAKRITRHGGLIFCAYVMNEYSVLTYCFKQNHIGEIPRSNQSAPVQFEFCGWKRCHSAYNGFVGAVLGGDAEKARACAECAGMSAVVPE